uniref:Uncharacterized protein n=1 Tax=Glossina brevipalpis TaxID=37001 RepID=A0A1A9W9H5_9MUSC
MMIICRHNVVNTSSKECIVAEVALFPGNVLLPVNSFIITLFTIARAHLELEMQSHTVISDAMQIEYQKLFCE